MLELSLKAALGAFLLANILRPLLRSIRNFYTLSSIPTVGPAGFFSSYLGAWRGIMHRRGMLAEGYAKYPGRAFKIPELNNWIVVITGPEMIDDLRRSKAGVFSLPAFFDTAFHTKNTMGSEVIFDEKLHVEAIRNSLTRDIKAIFEGLKDEVSAAFEDYIPAKDDWVAASPLEAARKIVCRSSNRVFVGLPLCRDPEYIDININFTIHIVLSALLLHLTPALLEPLFPLISKVPSTVKKSEQLLGPLIEKRFAMQAAGGAEWEGRPDDILSWMVSMAEEKDRNIPLLVRRILMINFASIHTTAQAFTATIFNLASYPEYIAPIREEVEEAVKADGWSKAAMERMHKLDSFIKEGLRLSSPSGLATPTRQLTEDFTFTNGITIPSGTIVGVASQPMHDDDSIYPNSAAFDGFRFYNLRTTKDGKTINQSMVNLTTDFGVFGYGKHACPGRFFAANELKLLISHVLLTYDFKYEPAVEEKYLGSPPDHMEFMNSTCPSDMKMLFRARKTV